MADMTELAERFAASGPPVPPLLAEVRRDLSVRFGARPADLALLSDEDYANDERVLVGHTRELWTITDPAVLGRLSDREERAQIVPEHELAQDLARVDAVVDLIERRYERTLVEHGSGLRTSVLLQWLPEQPDALGAFVVYGVLGSAQLQRYHEARFGTPNMKVGDLLDPEFRYYLRALAAEGLI